MKFILLLLIAVSLFLGCTSIPKNDLVPNQYELRSINSWENGFVKNWDKELKIALPKSLSGDSWDLYNLSYSIDANVAMFEASHKTVYLDRALLYVENVIERAQKSEILPQSQFKDSFLGWSNHSAPSQGDDGKEYPLFESYMWRYVSKLLYVISKDEALVESVPYGERYRKILNFTEQNIYNKWNSRGRSNIYRSNAHMASHWAVICLNLYSITTKPEYLKVVEDFVGKLRGRQNEIYTRENLTVYDWDPVWSRSYKTSQDVGHGNAVIGLIVDLYERNMFYTDRDILGLIELFDSIIWKDSETFAAFFDGSGKGSGWFTDGFIKLGRFSKPLQLRIENHNRGRSTQFFGNGALNASLIRKGLTGSNSHR